MSIGAWIFAGSFILVFGFLTLAPFILSGRISQMEDEMEAERRKREADSCFDHGEVPPSCE